MSEKDKFILPYSPRLEAKVLPQKPKDAYAVLLACAKRAANSAVEISKASTSSTESDASFQTGKHRLSALKNIAALLVDELGAKTVVIQTDVSDCDYASEYAAYYSKTFVSHPRLCSRLHFFSEKLAGDAESPIEFIDRIDKKNSYCGYVTLRPVMSCPVGSSVLKAPKKCQFLTIKDRFETTLAGICFEVIGTPFQQQDAAVGACVQTSLWMALRSVRTRDVQKRIHMHEITQAATSTQVFARVMPSRDGITVQQLRVALDRFGYHGFELKVAENFASFRDSAEHGKVSAQPLSNEERRCAIRAQLYPYFESGIPVILIFNIAGEGHAALLVGHGWPADAERSLNIVWNNYWTSRHQIDFMFCGNKKSLKLDWPTTNFVRELYVNDDRVGPYQLLDGFEKNGTRSIDDLAYFYPVLPKDVFVDAGEALEQMKAIVETVIIDIFAGLPDPSSIDKILEFFLVRQRLIDKKSLRFWAATLKNKLLSEYLRLKHFPERMWFFSLNSSGIYYKEPFDGRSQVGFVLIDATGDVDDSPTLSMHLSLGAVKEALRSLRPKEAENLYDKDVIVDFNPNTRQMTMKITEGHDMVSTF